jgi:ABC-type uncharacterized transport system substrate-binding protein
MRPLLFYLLLAALWQCALVVGAAEFKVLVVMSYEEQNPWVKEIREGIDSVLSGSSAITYFHMDTKVDPAGGPKKAEQAQALYQHLQPQGVIAVDDHAQALFVVPYLKDKVATPVMFAGVNAPAEQYGYPTRQISGVLERAHVRESLAFAKQLIPTLQNACALTNRVPPGEALRAQIEADKASYPLRFQAFHQVETVGELESLGETLRQTCEVLFVDSLEGILDLAGKSMNNREVLEVLARVYGGPLLGGNRYQVEQGAWAAVVKTGQEQGATAAEMLLRALRGTPVEQIPVTRNAQGQRVINVTAIESRGLLLRPLVLRGAVLVRQQP